MPGRGTRQKFPNALFNTNRHLEVSGSFETDSTNDPTNVRGNGFVVTRSGTGEYTITLPDYYAQMICCVANVESATEADSYVEVDSYTAATGVLILRVMDAATNGAVDEDGPRVNFIAKFQTRGDLAKTWTD